MDVVVTGEPEEAALAVVALAVVVVVVAVRVRRTGRHEDARSRAGTEKTSAAQETAPRDIGGRELAVRDGQVKSLGDVGGLPAVVVMVVAVAHAITPCVAR
ncbi:hypothetical protein Psuf_017060 [Phytohabitans suffuscus]|uniref:Uncharacterized protein n=1 Tax=Phytohabitans suffuscus TaxID=624315 RepID=A0A6F8YED9_9ACTN|nr:hypothetical protein Psuf_017060 [Phytohabitans suffuscus]